MVSVTPTMQEIIDYLESANFAASYVCGDGTLCDMFTRRILPSNISTQSSLGDGAPKRVWWIEYKEDTNKFVLRCSYFDAEGNPITYQTFVDQLNQMFPTIQVVKIPAVLYTPAAVIEWLPTTENEWTATFNVATPTSGCMIAGALNKIKKII